MLININICVNIKICVGSLMQPERNVGIKMAETKHWLGQKPKFCKAAKQRGSKQEHRKECLKQAVKKGLCPDTE